MKIILKALKKAHVIVKPDDSAFGRNWKMFPNREYASSLIHNALLSKNPLMIARLGANELQCMVNYIGVNQPDIYKSVQGYICNRTPPWWWNNSTMEQMHKCAGFFPANKKKLEHFCEMMIAELPKVDILGSWLKEEAFFSQQLQFSKKVVLEDLEPFFAARPWTWALENKRVLVVHPFATTIQRQYVRRSNLFDNNLLPEFELDVIQAVQSIAGQVTRFNDWFDALDWMKEEISKRDFDVCILGCGAYGFPLAGYVKDLGKKAIHMGGATQLLFGIRGARWEEFIVQPYSNLFNEFWVRPTDDERPRHAHIVENACYW